MLRITRRNDDRPALRLEGRLTRYEVGLLRETLRTGAQRFCVLELADLAFVDESGAAALVELAQRGIELRGGSPFVQQLLKDVAS
jgi:anti-anti-sigma regulatory factor